MNFKLLLAIGAFVGLFAFSTATNPKKNYMLSGLEKLYSSFSPNVREAEDATEDVSYILQAWMTGVAITTLDNIKFFDSTSTISTGPGTYSQLEFHNTHLRGLHRLGQEEGSSTVEHINDKESILTFTATSNALEFHSEMVERREDGSSSGMRSMATVKNLNVHMKVHITQGSLIPIRFLEFYIVGTPEVSVWGKTLNSQWGDAPTGSNSIIMAKVVEYLKKTHIPQLLRNVFSQKTINDVNKMIEKTLRKTNVNSEVGPNWLYDDLAFIWFYGYRSEMCQTYKLDLNHTLELESSTDRITVKNGAIRGLDYIRRTECGGLESCTKVPCPAGHFIFDYDDIYIDYDVHATVNGRSSQGKMTLTISGMQEKDAITCVDHCAPGVPWICTTVPEVDRAEFSKLGKVLVDVEGLPEELHPRHSDLIAFAENTRAKLLQQITAGAYGDSHFDNKLCTVV